MAFENPGNGFLLSPLELAGLIDEVNSAYLGLCFNPGYGERSGKAVDWVRILDKRILAVRLEAGRSDENDAEMLAQLERRRWEGSLIYG